MTTTDLTIRPFEVHAQDEDLADLRRRIAATRWPSKELVDDRSQGVQLATLQELARYWTTDYHWRACEARLNALPQFTTGIDGVDIHFIHVRSRHKDALPRPQQRLQFADVHKLRDGARCTEPDTELCRRITVRADLGILPKEARVSRCKKNQQLGQRWSHVSRSGDIVAHQVSSPSWTLHGQSALLADRAR